MQPLPICALGIHFCYCVSFEKASLYKTMTKKELLEKISSPNAGELFAQMYGPDKVAAARQRYTALIEEMPHENYDDSQTSESSANDEQELRVFSAPGRTELAGNHTDHNYGKVLAAAIQLDTVAIVRKRGDNTVFFRSAGYPGTIVRLRDENGNPLLLPRPEEQGKTEALVRGIAADFIRPGATVNGFTANADSTVPPGSGLSSSAAIEVLIGRIFDCLYGNGTRSAEEIARIGQIAENDYFGKPCGLMDQTACATGGTVAIDFSGGAAASPQVQQINFDPAAVGYVLCIINTAGTHADLTSDYMAIPDEMKTAAAFFGKTVLAELDRETLLSLAADIRKAAGDRVLLRALHFFDENERVDEMTAALSKMDKTTQRPIKHGTFSRFLELVNQSGDSSWQLLQNIYSPRDTKNQGISTALAVTKNFFNRQKIQGACRVHGGGFAGTIQAYLPADALEAYKNCMETLFGENSLTQLYIRPLGAVELEL